MLFILILQILTRPKVKKGIFLCHMKMKGLRVIQMMLGLQQLMWNHWVTETKSKLISDKNTNNGVHEFQKESNEWEGF